MGRLIYGAMPWAVTTSSLFIVRWVSRVVSFIISIASGDGDADSVQFIPINVQNERAQHNDQTRGPRFVGGLCPVVGCDCCRPATTHPPLTRGLCEVARISGCREIATLRERGKPRRSSGSIDLLNLKSVSLTSLEQLAPN